MDSSSCTLQGTISGCIPCCHTLNWPQKNPLKMGFAIALIFAFAALLAHFVFKAQLGWPIGLAATGFVVALGITIYYYRKAAIADTTGERW